MVPDQTTVPARTLRRKLFATVATLAAVALLGAFGTYAAYTATTDNTGNQISSGSVKVDQHAGATAVYNVSNQKPGQTKTSCVRVTYSGSLPAAVRMYRTNAANGGNYSLDIERGSGLTAPAADMNCNGFTPASIASFTSLGFFPLAYATGMAGKPGDAAWAPGDTVDYRFTVTTKDDTTANAHTSSTFATNAHDYVWEARSFDNYANELLTTPGLQAYWRLGDPYGPTAYDATSTSPFNATYVGGPTYGATGISGTGGNSAVMFDGVDDHATSTNPSLNVRTGSKSWEVWFKTTGTTQAYLYRKSDANNDNGLLLSLNTDGTPTCLLGLNTNSIGTTGPTALNNGQYHHLVCTLDRAANQLKLYVDGTNVGATRSTTIYNGVDLNAANDANLGGQANGWFAGALDETAVYSRALTPTEIKRHYDLGS